MFNIAMYNLEFNIFLDFRFSHELKSEIPKEETSSNKQKDLMYTDPVFESNKREEQERRLSCLRADPNRRERLACSDQNML